MSVKNCFYAIKTEWNSKSENLKKANDPFPRSFDSLYNHAP